MVMQCASEVLCCAGRSQVSGSIAKVFRCLDADGNGFLDRDELMAGFAAMVHALRYRVPMLQVRLGVLALVFSSSVCSLLVHEEHIGIE
jgi:hypothetical protein